VKGEKGAREPGTCGPNGFVLGGLPPGNNPVATGKKPGRGMFQNFEGGKTNRRGRKGPFFGVGVFLGGGEGERWGDRKGFAALGLHWLSGGNFVVDYSAAGGDSLGLIREGEKGGDRGGEG